VQLVQTKDTVASIAHRAGFSDQVHLTRTFEKRPP
jgi:AraC-like DNA-binding protein